MDGTGWKARRPGDRGRRRKVQTPGSSPASAQGTDAAIKDVLAHGAPGAYDMAKNVFSIGVLAVTVLATIAMLVAPGVRADAAVSESAVLAPSAGVMLQYTDGKLDKPFTEGIFGVDGGVVYCVDSESNFAAGTVTSQDILTMMSQELLTEVALRVHYATEVYDGADLSSNTRILLAQALIWDAQGGPHAYTVASTEEGGNLFELTSAIRDEVTAGAKAFACENASKYIGHGTLWVNGTTQRVASFWLEAALGRLKLQKSSSNASITGGNGCYSLKGAVFTVYGDKACTVAEETLRTDDDGFAESGDLPAGTHYVKETSAPSGYALDSSTVHEAYIRPGETTLVGGSSIEDEPLSTPDLPVLQKSCSEAEWSPSGAQSIGSCSLSGAQYTVDFYPSLFDKVDDARRSGNPDRTWVYQTDGDGRIDFSAPERHLVSGTLYTDSAGKAAYPLGTYLVYESLAPAGYEASSAVYLVRVEQYGDGVTVRGDARTVGSELYIAEPERPKRGDIAFVKVRESDMSRLPLVPFVLTSETTGESHIVVTDENGRVDTSSSWNPHTRRTNANDTALGIDAADASFDLDSGVWFGLLGNGQTTPANDDAGALPYDTYTLEELPCESNEGLQLLTIAHISVRRDATTVDLGSIVDGSSEAPFVNTRAYDALTLSKSVCADSQSRLVDHVEYMNLSLGEEYEVLTTLVDASTGDPIAGATARTSFVARSANGSLDIEVEAPLIGSEASRVAFFEELRLGGRVVAEHKDALDPEQTLLVCQPSVSTSAHDASDLDKTVVTCHTATIVDTVSYTGLVPGAAYTLEGVLMERVALPDGEGFGPASELVDTSGVSVKASVELVPESSSGSTDVEFQVDLDAMDEPCAIVAFERLLRDGFVVASHEDENDEAQTLAVVNPEVSTYATDTHDGDKNVAWSADAHVMDEVVLENLVPGANYTLYGTVVDASTGLPALFEKTVQQEVSDDPNAAAQKARVQEFWSALGCALGVSSGEGAETYALDPASSADLGAAKSLLEEYDDVVSLMCMGRTDFEASAQCMTTSIDYGFDACTVDGDFVIYDLLLSEDKVAAVHADIGNEAQSFEIARPSITTEATDDADNDHTVLPSMDVSLTDTVFYEGLVSGEEYVLRGLVMDRASDTAFCPGGEAVTGELAFTPSGSAGSVKVPFCFDASSLCDGYELVVFEYLLKDGETVAEHASLEDSLQTVKVGAPPEGSGYDKTGGSVEGASAAGMIAAIGAGLVAVSAVCLIATRARVLHLARKHG